MNNFQPTIVFNYMSLRIISLKADSFSLKYTMPDGLNNIPDLKTVMHLYLDARFYFNCTFNRTVYYLNMIELLHCE